ncbi:MAG TPA: CHASE domain-containing protein, partial [Ilumatobacteraceae bacterium]|nr:CHASE domain-containing protein [Ilumatobacteraceae bacterium]
RCEDQAGINITERGVNGLIAAESRAEYLPVQYVYPVTETSRSVVGFDTASDRDRYAASSAARDLGALSLSPPVPSQPSGQTSVYFAQPLFKPGLALGTVEQRRAAIVGFATGLRPASAILESVMAQLPDGARVRVTDGEQFVAGTAEAPSGGHSSTISVGGRTWVVLKAA